MNTFADWAPIFEIMRKASQAVLDSYKSDFTVSSKEDATPVTSADLEANQIIMDGLREYYPEIPIISEEIQNSSIEERSSWNRFFLIDPIDGTSEFVAHQGDFTVNIALIENGLAVLGFVAVPVTGELFVGNTQESWVTPLWNKEDFQSRRLIKESWDLNQMNPESKILVSVLHFDEPTEKYVSSLGGTVLPIGSSLKFCRIADGTANYYPRLRKLHEWDIAAGHAILKGALGNVYLWKTKTELRYGSSLFETEPFEAY